MPYAVVRVGTVRQWSMCGDGLTVRPGAAGLWVACIKTSSLRLQARDCASVRGKERGRSLFQCDAFSDAAVRCGLKVNVKVGDSCSSIAHAHGLHVLELQQLNYNLDCTQLAPSNVTQLCVDPAGGFAGAWCGGAMCRAGRCVRQRRDELKCGSWSVCLRPMHS